MIRADSPQFRVRPVHHAVVWDDPLPVERAEAVEDWRCALAMLIGDWRRSGLIAGKAIMHDALAVPVSGSMRMKEDLLFDGWGIDELLPTSLQ